MWCIRRGFVSCAGGGPYQGMERRSQASPEGSSLGAVDDHVVG
jgi:hypothetical protein